MHVSLSLLDLVYNLVSKLQYALSLSQGKDPQLERAVSELMKQLSTIPKIDIEYSPYPTPAKKN